MKKLLTLILIVLTAVSGFSQSQRLVLLEEFTSSTCGPCAGVNPTFHNWQVQNPTKFTSIYWHVSWPSPGNDPMYLANKPENNARVSYYGVTYVPFSVLDGNYYSGSANGWNMTTVNNRWAVPSPFEIKARHRISTGLDSVYVTMLAKVTQNITASLTAHNVVIEKHIHFNTAPGTNGEKDFYNVMKKMLAGTGGTNLPTVQVAGDYVIYEGAWKFGTVYDKNEIAAVSFIQNKSTKEVCQAANSSTDPIVMPYNNDVQVMELSGLPTSVCFGKLSPKVKIRNNGNNAVTGFQVKYKVNGGDLQSYTWSGSIQSLEKTVITLPEYSFIPQANNTLRVYSIMPNSVNDEYPKNDTLTTIIKEGPSTTNTIFIVLRSDSLPQQISWDVKNSLGQVVQVNNPYTQINHTYFDTINLPAFDCYTFTIYDAGGNGLCCAHGSGGYELRDSQGVYVVNNGGSFAFSESTEFNLSDPTGIGSVTAEMDLTIYPNPFNDRTTVSFNLKKSEEVTLSLFNIVGQQILDRNLGMLGAGSHQTVIDGDGIRPGIYLLRLRSGANTTIRKVSVNR